MKLRDPDKDLQELFKQLVESPSQKETSHPKEPVEQVLSKAVADENIRQRLREKITIRVPVLNRLL